MSAIRDLIWDAIKGADHVLLALCVLASSFGVVLIYSSSQYKVAMHSLPYKQAICMVIGIVLYFVMTQFDIQILLEKWYLVVVFCVILQLLVRVPGLGVESDGNLAWVKIPLVGLTLQPAELNKLFFTLLLAGALVHLQQNGDVSSFPNVVKLLGILGLAVGLIVVVTKDVGSSLIYAFIWLAMLWVAGVKKRWFALGAAVAAVGCYGLWRILPDSNHMKARFLVLLDHDYDPLGTGFQQTRSMAAIRSGGLFGQGFLKGVITQSSNNNALSQRNSDFIFASCAEEWGLVGCTFLLLLLAAIILRCLYIASTASDTFSALVAVGFSGMLIAQIFINVGMCLYVMPVIGLTLPFISNGGTSLILTFLAMGVLSGIHARSLPTWLRDRSDIKWN
jgi:rod shape determining protein RodA